MDYPKLVSNWASFLPRVVLDQRTKVIINSIEGACKDWSQYIMYISVTGHGVMQTSLNALFGNLTLGLEGEPTNLPQLIDNKYKSNIYNRPVKEIPNPYCMIIISRNWEVTPTYYRKHFVEAPTLTKKVKK